MRLFLIYTAEDHCEPESLCAELGVGGMIEPVHEDKEFPAKAGTLVRLLTPPDNPEELKKKKKC